MTLNQIEYVIKAAEMGSINKAANRLFVSQSVVSTAIKGLENELGRELFIRTSKGIELTPFGKTFINYVTPIGQQISLLDNFLNHKGGTANQILSVTSNGYNFLSPIVVQLYERHLRDGLRIDLREGSSIDSMNAVANRISDLGFVCIYDCHMPAYRSQLKTMKLEYHPIVQLELGIMVGPKNPLYTREENWVTPDMLTPYPMVMYTYMDDNPFSDIIKRLQLKSNSSRICSGSRAALYEATAYTDAYYLNSDYSKCRYYGKYPEINYLPRRALRFKDCSIKNNLGWISRADSLLTPIQQEFVDLLCEFLSIEP